MFAAPTLFAALLVTIEGADGSGFFSSASTTAAQKTLDQSAYGQSGCTAGTTTLGGVICGIRENRRALIKVLDRPYLDLTTPMGKGILAFMSALAEIAREKNVQFGRKPKLSEHQKDKARKRLAAGEATREIAKDFGVSHPTISRLGK